MAGWRGDRERTAAGSFGLRRGHDARVCRVNLGQWILDDFTEAWGFERLIQRRHHYFSHFWIDSPHPLDWCSSI